MNILVITPTDREYANMKAAIAGKSELRPYLVGDSGENGHFEQGLLFAFHRAHADRLEFGHGVQGFEL